ncbi:hypothetical protein [Planktotalea sp.]|uniref:hypothetical protein n=1 Tax=Planktotalea sp. TaxID=2029877 RepID=UPI003F6C8662
MSKRMRDTDDLEVFFEAAKSSPPAPSSDFMARVLSDAESMQPEALGVMQSMPPQQSGLKEFFSALSDAIGGWRAFAGLATAAVTGLWIGISPPAGLIEPFGSVLGTDTSALSDAFEYGEGFDFTMFEG